MSAPRLLEDIHYRTCQATGAIGYMIVKQRFTRAHVAHAKQMIKEANQLISELEEMTYGSTD